MRSFVICTPYQFYLGDQIKKYEIACMGDERCIQVFDGETLGKETTWKN
jgi:hypothetical protein